MDEVAAEHVGADCIVHYGRACLSPTTRLPLIYVFERRPLDLEKCAAAFRELYPDTQSHVVVLYDVNYSHAIGRPLLQKGPAIHMRGESFIEVILLECKRRGGGKHLHIYF